MFLYRDFWELGILTIFSIEILSFGDLSIGILMVKKFL